MMDQHLHSDISEGTVTLQQYTNLFRVSSSAAFEVPKLKKQSNTTPSLLHQSTIKTFAAVLKGFFPVF